MRAVVARASGRIGPPVECAALPRPARERAVLACVCACTILVVGFVASVNLAVPGLAASTLHPTAAELLWIVDAYVVLFACLVIPAGALGDRAGRKGVLLAGLGLFAVGAATSAVAGDVGLVLVGRVVTGVGAACVLPNALAVLVHAVPPERRPRALAVWAAMSGLGGLVGNVGGGAVLTVGSWRWLFAAVVPVGLACALWVARVAPRSPRHERPLDPAGTALLTLASVALFVGIIQGPEAGWGGPLVVGAFVASAVLLAVWVAVELRVEQPLLDPRLFAAPRLRAACLGMLIVFFGMFGLFFVNASLLQYVHELSVLQAGLGVVPLSLPLLLGTRFVPGLVARFGERMVLAVAFLLVSVGLGGLATAVDGAYIAYAGWLVVVGAGATLALPTLTTAITESLPRDRAGVAGGLQATTRELGSALGVAVIGTLLTSGFVQHLSRSAGQGRGDVPRTVAEALVAAPRRHDAVLAAYASGACSALRIVAVVVLVAGALTTVEMALAARRRR